MLLSRTLAFALPILMLNFVLAFAFTFIFMLLLGLLLFFPLRALLIYFHFTLRILWLCTLPKHRLCQLFYFLLWLHSIFLLHVLYLPLSFFLDFNIAEMFIAILLLLLLHLALLLFALLTWRLHFCYVAVVFGNGRKHLTEKR